MEGHSADDQNQSTGDMSAFVQNLLQQMQSTFQAMSDSIVTKIDDMGNRINELEQSISDLKSEMGMEGSPSPIQILMKPRKSKVLRGISQKEYFTLYIKLLVVSLSLTTSMENEGHCSCVIISYMGCQVCFFLFSLAF